MKLHGLRLAVLASGLLLAATAHASFHIMQIEQVIGGVGGDTNAQAIQLRMRSSFQNQMQLSRINVRDASGANPILVVDMTHPVANSNTGDRVLIASAGMASDLALTPDFVMTNLDTPELPRRGEPHLRGRRRHDLLARELGRCRLLGHGRGEHHQRRRRQRESGVRRGAPSSTSQALQFPGTSGAPSTNNAADYALTVGAATFTNNARQSATIVNVATVPEQPAAASVQLGRPAPNPVTGMMSYSVTLPREAHVTLAVYDLRGRRVGLVADRTLGAGSHSLSWNTATAGLGSGLYFLRLDAGTVQRSQKFTLIH
jgi:hypothetical protein